MAGSSTLSLIVILVAILGGIGHELWKSICKNGELKAKIEALSEKNVNLTRNLALLQELEHDHHAHLSHRCPRCGKKLSPSNAESPWGYCNSCRKIVKSLESSRLMKGERDIDCRSGEDVVISPPKGIQGSAGVLRDSDAEKGARSLRQCGYAFLARFFDPKDISDMASEISRILEDPKYQKTFEIPVSGLGRREFMLPFRRPFNESFFLRSKILRDVIHRFLSGEHIKLHLLSVVISEPDSDDQGWHQDFRYLFSADNQDQPYAVQVGIPLQDWSDDMGPTQFCPRHNQRFYNGQECDRPPLAAASELGDAVIWDYRELHRGPANFNRKNRSMILAAFSRTFFVNNDAFINRGTSLIQSLHQRRFWEASYWHPEDPEFFS